MKTINYELAKKLYDAGVKIKSEKNYEQDETLIDSNNPFDIVQYPAPNCEEVIEFLSDIKIDKFHLSIDFCSWLTIVNYRSSGSILFPYIEEPTLLEALEATLEYLLDNWYILKQ